MTQDETMAVEISPHQFSICQEANGLFYNILTPFQPLANLSSCITALYTKTQLVLLPDVHSKSGNFTASV